MMALAQTDSTATSCIGIFAETNSIASGDVPTINTYGLQYQRMNRNHLSYIISAGYGNYSYNQTDPFNRIAGDTSAKRYYKDDINLATAGFGVEAEHHVYHRLWIFAGFNARLGYGTGTTDTTEQKQYNVHITNPAPGMPSDLMGYNSRHIASGSESLLCFGFTPHVGVKLQFGRLFVGTSFMNYALFRNIYAGNHSYGSFDFNMGNITQRVFVNYRL
jgi:hypothetical protein